MTKAKRKRSTTGRANHAHVDRKKPPFLTDEQWIEIVSHSKLPDEARPSVEGVIAHYRRMQARIGTRKTPSDLREELEALRKNTESLLTRFGTFLTDPDAFFALAFRQSSPTGWPQGAGPVSQAVAWDQLSSAGHQLRRLADWLAVARDCVRPGKPGTNARQSEPAYVLAELLNETLERWTGKTLTRSSKKPDTTKFVEAVCKIADPDIGSGTIEEAIKRQIKYDRARGKVERRSEGVTSPRNSSDKRFKARKTTKRNSRAK